MQEIEKCKFRSFLHHPEKRRRRGGSENWELHVVKLCCAIFFLYRISPAPQPKRKIRFKNLFNKQPIHERQSLLQLRGEQKKSTEPSALYVRKNGAAIGGHWNNRKLLGMSLMHLERVQKCPKLNSNRLCEAIIDFWVINSNSTFCYVAQIMNRHRPVAQNGIGENNPLPLRRVRCTIETDQRGE